MGLMDNLKARLEPAKDKVSGLAQQHGHKVTDGLDKAAKMVDEKTRHKYSDTIRTGTGKAKDAVDRLAAKDGEASGASPDTPTRPDTPTPPDMPTRPDTPTPPDMPTRPDMTPPPPSA